MNITLTPIAPIKVRIGCHSLSNHLRICCKRSIGETVTEMVSSAVRSKRTSPSAAGVPSARKVRKTP